MRRVLINNVNSLKQAKWSIVIMALYVNYALT